MVERDSPWTDDQRARMLALVEYREACCPDCGAHESADAVVVPDERRCPFCAGLAVHHRVKQDEDQRHLKQLGDNPDPKTPRPGDGRRLFLRPATPEELIQREQRKQRHREG